MQKTKVHIIPHSHWDKEWYFTSSRSKIYLIKHIKEVLDVLENKEDFGFFLMDAQSSLIEDYLKYCPSDEERLKKLISEKKFFNRPLEYTDRPAGNISGIRGQKLILRN